MQCACFQITEIIGESILQAFIQVMITLTEGTPDGTWNSVVRVGGICISIISIIYGAVTFCLRNSLGRDPSMIDYACCCRITFC